MKTLLFLRVVSAKNRISYHPGQKHLLKLPSLPQQGKSGLQCWTGGALAPSVACQNEPTLAAEGKDPTH